jgi:hypothetical protein
MRGGIFLFAIALPSEEVVGWMPVGRTLHHVSAGGKRIFPRIRPPPV